MSGVCHKGERHFFALVGFTMRGIGDSLTPWEGQRSAQGIPDLGQRTRGPQNAKC
jgi:hypothetical protein